MNITVFSHYFAPEIGAPSARIYDMAQQWIKLRHQVQVVTCFPNHPTGKIYPGYQPKGYACEMLNGIKVHRHWTYITPNKGFLKKTMGHASYWPSSAWHSEGHLDRPDVTIGTSPTFFAAMASHRAARRHGIPHIMEVRDLWPAAFVELGVLKNPLMISLLEKWEMRLYRQAHRVVTVTESFRNNLVQRGVGSEKVFSIPNGADEDFWRPQAKSEKLLCQLGLQGKFVALYIGAHGISQALSAVLDSARILQRQSNIHFLFVGEGAEKDALVARARATGLNNVQFLEPVNKEAVKDFYALADVCLVPLRDIPLFKTFIPSKMFEMMAMERPILASVSGEAAEILGRSGGAIVVPPEDSQAIASGLQSLAGDSGRCQQLGRSGRTFVIENYSRRALATKYISVIKTAREELKERH